MLFVLGVAVVVLGGSVAAALYLPLMALIVITVLAVCGIAYAGHVGSTRDEVAGSMGIYGALLLTVATIVQWVFYFFVR